MTRLFQNVMIRQKGKNVVLIVNLLAIERIKPYLFGSPALQNYTDFILEICVR